MAPALTVAAGEEDRRDSPEPQGARGERGDEDPLREVACWLFLAAASVTPFNLVLNDLAGRDLHVTMVVLAGVLGAAALRCIGGARPRLETFVALDWLAVGFLAWAVFHLAFLGSASGRAAKGFLVETRLAWIYLAARVAGLDRRFLRRLLNLYMGLAIAAGLWGLIEFYIAWGSLLQVGDRLGHARYRKRGIARLYTPVLTPAQSAYFLYGGISAAAARWSEGSRVVPAATVLLAMVALPLTLTRTAFAWTLLALPALAAAKRSLRSFFVLAVACGIVSILVFRTTGVSQSLTRYASQGGAMLSDPSAKVHDTAVRTGATDMRTRPLGYGFGEAGHIAQTWGGRAAWNETYFLTLGVQAGVPAVALVVGMYLFAGIRCARAALNRDGGLAAGGLFALTFLLGIFAGSLFLPIGSTAWVQVLLFPAVAAVVNEQARGNPAESAAT